jgi:hypothetical protein
MITSECKLLVLILRYGICNPDVDHMAFFQYSLESSLCHKIPISSLSLALALVIHIILSYHLTLFPIKIELRLLAEYSKDVQKIYRSNLDPPFIFQSGFPRHAVRYRNRTIHRYPLPSSTFSELLLVHSTLDYQQQIHH